jgi:hypothetical protein
VAIIICHTSITNMLQVVIKCIMAMMNWLTLLYDLNLFMKLSFMLVMVTNNTAVIDFHHTSSLVTLILLMILVVHCINHQFLHPLNLDFYILFLPHLYLIYILNTCSCKHQFSIHLITSRFLILRFL